MKAVCIFLAEGFEEMKAMFPLDIMRRGGLNVKTAVCRKIGRFSRRDSMI